MKNIWKSTYAIPLLLVLMIGCSMTVCAAGEGAIHVQYEDRDEAGFDTDSSSQTITAPSSGEYVLEGDWDKGLRFSIAVPSSTKVSIASGAKIYELKRGTIEENNGEIPSMDWTEDVTVKVNNGIIKRAEGMVVTNNGTIKDNFGTVTTNNSTIEGNAGTVTNNKGTIEKNYGEVVVTNETGGIVEINAAEIGTNNGVVEANEEDATIVTNNGRVKENKEGATIETNNGIVAVNVGTITTNAASGKVYGNTGEIETDSGFSTSDPEPEPSDESEVKHEKKEEKKSSHKEEPAEPTPHQIEQEAIYSSVESQIASIGSSPDGTVTIDGKDLVNSLPAATMKKIADNPNVSVSFTYIYNGVKYTTTIPAGAAIDPTIEWFGPLYLMYYYPTVWQENASSQVPVNSPVK